MKRIIEGLIYNTATATEICTLECRFHSTDFQHHETSLYRTPKGRYFLAGTGGALSMWGRQGERGNRHEGEGIKPISMEEARRYAEEEGMGEEEMIAAGFTVEEA